MLKTATLIKKGACIDQVSEDSIAGEVGLESGDCILKINGTHPRDIINYRLLSYGEDIELEIIKKDGEPLFVEIEKEEGEPLGISFSPSTINPVRTCVNKCIFCFVKQNPPGMRKSVTFRDDDYRLSFLEGNYITLNNLTKKDLKRIVSKAISPLYVSVHTTDGRLRKKMMKNYEAAHIMAKLRYLSDNNIRIHAQIVVCPGWNDGEPLQRTVKDLATLNTAVQSLAVVPVGLTRYRKNLTSLRTPTKEEAIDTLKFIHGFQQKMLGERGSRFVYAADEYYLAAGLALPTDSDYEDYPQLANGVGLLRLFLEELEELAQYPERPSFDNPVSIILITGEAARDYLSKAVDFLNQIPSLNAELKVVPNRFFGGHVNVAGLLTGKDIIDELSGNVNAGILFIPSVALKEEQQIFLDGTSVKELEDALKIPVKPVNTLTDIWNILIAMGKK